MFLAGCDAGNILRFRHDVTEKTLLEIEALTADEPHLANPDSTALHLDEYVDLLSAEMPVEQISPGLIYHFPDGFSYDHNVRLTVSGTPEGDRLLAALAADEGMPQTLLDLGFRIAADIWPPWCIALHEDEIASIGMTARLGPAGAESGVVTVPEFRGRGFAAAAVSGWASHPELQHRSLFYSTQSTNVSSQRVAARLGLRFLGASLRLT